MAEHALLHEGIEVPHNPNDKPIKYGLSPLRVLRGALCLLVLLYTSFMMLVYFAFFSAVILRFFSVHHSRNGTCFLFGTWLALWPFLFEKINKTKVIFSGDDVPSRERALLISNHRTEVDWMYIWDLALRKERLGYVKYILKNSLMKLPIFGWAFHILEFIPVARRWEVDETNMHQILSTFKDPRDSLWLAVFPEGTDFTEQKCIRSQKYAAENGLPVFKNVLLPKTKGFLACLEELSFSLDAVYDLTIGYKNRCPSFLDNAFGVEPAEVHIHVRRIPVNEIPISEDDTGSWLVNTFSLKDRMLTDFYSQGYFSHDAKELHLSTATCLLNCLIVLVFTGIGTYFTFFSSVWFRIYVLLVCAYFASATFLHVRPVPLIK
ncbi:probable 1-acyl-sn-glycerol-3-phosphate acyltransferase 5 isoform X1 [Impatiens glandulifera]|uniref:probable 1-acyl-sn-glycerol-3-phosphate acyltransferase 5 isoform X1 n=1 Tax=Impatiens glandulifera TaxID=253017 RepID=UPI001FB09C8A|nr:probable 1-acyl-sn-glycerol-3-phosphate acyltransferase 5 isoform X1 [Impatiens glandulifera]